MMRYAREYKLPEYDIDLITANKNLADIFEQTVAICNNSKKVSNWLMVETMYLVKEKNREVDDISFSPSNLAKLINLVEARTINGKVAKEVFEKIFDEDVDPEVYVKEHGLATVNDEGVLRSVIERIIAANPKSVDDINAGKLKAMGFLVGQTMKEMKGKADPASINAILNDLLLNK